MKRILVLAMAVLLGACASSGTREGMVYRDGSWYTPAEAGRGDYYTGTQRQHQPAYDWPWAWSVGFVPFGGYCPAQYRYCTSFWAGDPFYSGPGYYYPYWYAWQPPVVHRRRPLQSDPPPMAEAGNRLPPSERRGPRAEREGDGGAGERPRREGRGEGRPRRRAADAGTHPN